MKRRSRAAVPGIKPGSQRLNPPLWQASQARGTAADTDGAVRRELREMAGPRRDRDQDAAGGPAANGPGRRFAGYTDKHQARYGASVGVRP